MISKISKEAIEEHLYKNPFSVLLGMEITEIDEGEVTGRIRFEKMHENFYGTMHGGCSFALADTIAGFAALTYGDYVTTVNSNMNYLKAVKDTEYVYCEASVVRHGKKITVVNADILNDDHEILMTGTITYYSTGPIKNKED